MFCKGRNRLIFSAYRPGPVVLIIPQISLLQGRGDSYEHGTQGKRREKENDRRIV